MAAILKGWLRRRENRLLERVGRRGGGGGGGGGGGKGKKGGGEGEREQAKTRAPPRTPVASLH